MRMSKFTSIYMQQTLLSVLHITLACHPLAANRSEKEVTEEPIHKSLAFPLTSLAHPPFLPSLSLHHSLSFLATSPVIIC